MNKIIYKNFDRIFIAILIIIFYIYNYKRIDYGLPFFLNLDETSFLYSTIYYLKSITGFSGLNSNPIYAPLINLIFVLKSIFVNEMIINSLNLEEIKNKIYFNPELIVYYGRIASLSITSISIIFLYLIFKKLKINFLIYSFLLISFSTSLMTLDISNVNGKNSYFLLLFLVQLFFFIKYLKKIEKFNYKSYFIFAILGSIAWGVNYWPALISLYSIFFLHLKKYRFSKLHFVITFLIIFIFFGPYINSLFVSETPFEIMDPRNKTEFQLMYFIKSFLTDLFISLKIIFQSEKNIFLLIIFAPIYLMHKKTIFKKEFLIIFFLIFEPIILFGISDMYIPQLRYFAGNFCIILILIAITFDELYKKNLRFLVLIIIFFNTYIIYNNLDLNNKINNLISKNHSFYKFNKDINKDRSKILYLVDLGFQESLRQNLLYVDLYENGLIKKNKIQNDFYLRVKRKIEKINNTKQITINNKELKKDLIYFNYTFFQIQDLKLFFKHIAKDFDYIVVEDSKAYYLSSEDIRIQISDYAKNNFLLEKTLFEEKKIFLRSLRSVIHYFENAINRYDYSENIYNRELEVVYGSNYSLYKIN
jgi:hypothetical protein